MTAPTIFDGTTIQEWRGIGHDFIPLINLSPNDYKYYIYKHAERVGVWRNNDQPPQENGAFHGTT